MQTIDLTVQARDNHNCFYDISLQEALRVGHEKHDYVLRIHNTPGQWFMTTLEGRPNPTSNVISIDWGAKWDCINFAQVMDAALEALKDVERISLAEDKAHDDAVMARLRNMNHSKVA